ncbi:MAG: hypothetical protein IPK07_15280 [Deltaproteobacteria bacterium]|jgi:hypothetical protein|nr:hypothetical protein [Deltaproteobacteria bacterium]
MTVAYWLDAADRIVAVNAAWDAFARANAGEAVLAGAVIGQPIRRFIADVATASIYHRLFQRARARGGPVKITFRCDSPGERRLFEMVLATTPERLVSVSVRALEVEPRAPLAVLSACAERSDEWVRMCGWCHRVDDGADRWLELEHAVESLAIFHHARPPRVTHAVCPGCLARLQAELDGLDAR